MLEFNCNDNFCEEKESNIIQLKPYPNEYSCRINDPGKYTTFRRQDNAGKHNGKRLDFIFGIKGGKSEIQAIRMPHSDWTKEEARVYCNTKEHISFE